jgi:hypothetical protein
MFIRCLICIVASLATEAPVVGQTTVEGFVHDLVGNPIASATLVLKRRESKELQKTLSNSAGAFVFVRLESGPYELKAEAAGYYPIIYELVLRPRQNFSIRVDMQPKYAKNETVEVKTHTSIVDPDKTGSSYTFTVQDLENLPDPVTDSSNSLAINLMPGASDSHDNFVGVRGTEFSLHEFINGVSFLDNTQPQFSPGISPQIFETVDLITGGFTPEYGNRFGGVLDIATRSGADLGGHGDLNFRGATLDNNDMNVDYGAQYRQAGYYFFADGFTSGRFLDPPQPHELYDFGKGARGTAQVDWHVGANDTLKLLLIGGGDNFQQPNIFEDQAVVRDAQRHLRQQTAILNWLHTFSSQILISTSVYERISSDRVLPTTDQVTPYSHSSRSPLTLGIKSDLSNYWNGHFFKVGIELVRLREGESFFFDSRGDPDVFPAFSGALRGGQGSAYIQDHFSPVRNLTLDVGLRYDYFDLVDTGVQTSPRLGLAYHITHTKSVLHAAYNHYFSPPPIE